MSRRPAQLALALNRERAVFKAFLVAQVGNEAEAEDLLQHGLLKAFQHSAELQDDTKLTAWFYRLLRNALIDHHRSRTARRRREDLLSTTLAALGEDIDAAPPAWAAQLCSCLGGVVDTLKPPHAALLRRVDLEGESVQAAAQSPRAHPEQRERHPPPRAPGSPRETPGLLRRMRRRCVPRLRL